MTMFSGNHHLFTILHFAAMAGLALYGLHRMWLLVCWYRESGRKSRKGILAVSRAGKLLSVRDHSVAALQRAVCCCEAH